MNKVRIQFSKGGALRFIGHLDFLRVFLQAVRRSGLPVAYSQGFNPHILLSFALPLPLGMESICDYADLVFEKPLDWGKAAEKLQAHAPGGLKILQMRETAGRGAAAVVAAADYTLEGTPATDLLAAETIIIPKKTKSGTKDTDIRPDIFDITTQADKITMRLAAGSARFINPQLVAGILLGREVAACEIKRVELYERIGEGFAPLL
ncbi:MAG: TIGR03936 family radical SAM-associated protein [Defluviitaleaceae bacterium]|nr:TIGR03936 family radical SAM-associated protein [Defluviitaleaceae bacterium]MCL2238595.1 TIGR03936 family radical SAM-associated protein [Defluviitaleaceae bacterium]